MKLAFGTGVFCPQCGTEVQYTGGFWKSFFMTRPLVDYALARLNRDGGELVSERCGHKWHVDPGTLQIAK